MNTEPGPMPKGRIQAFGVYFIVLHLALLYVLVKIWPGTLESLKLDDKVALLGDGRLVIPLPPEVRYLLIVVIVGALGSYVHLATSFSDFVGNRRLEESWGWWYLLRPFIGSALAVILYFVVRGGLVTGSTGAGNLSPYGVAAIAGLAGMFHLQAIDKLREVFINLFKTEKPPKRLGKLSKAEEQEDTSTRPKE